MKTLIGAVFAFFFFSIIINASAQIINVPKRVQTKTVNRVNNKIDRGIDKGLDEVEKGIKGDQKKDDKAASDTKTGKEQKDQADKTPATSDKQSQQTLQSYSSYDFVPGDKVLLFEDFSQDAVGDFPALWTTDVAGEVNTLNLAPGHWFNLNSTEGNYWFMNDIDFPKNFIIEFDIVPKKGGARYAADLLLFGESSHSEMDKNGDPGNCGIHVTIAKTLWETKGYKKGTTEKLSGTSKVNLVQEEKVNHVIVWVQGRRLRIYHQGGKVLDVPTNLYDGCKLNRMCFKLYRGASCGSYISNIKITNAAPDMRNKLLTEGKLVTYGIYFDVNKDVIKPESYGTLKGIAEILNEVPEVKVKIVGHTDSDGADAANLDLSKRRAASVKAELVKSFNVNGDRLVTDGMGESQPVAPNDTPVNKALNRRVEFIKL
ncbi:MAG: OmpA family protein [Lentimicrobiaceae bacterium]|jgi:outer membrane protein OmpA-like peptidoglycan-associated protein